MSQDPKQFRDLIVRPSLELLSAHHPKMNTLWSERLVMGTWAQESAGGKYIRQIGFTDHTEGAFGGFQMEYKTQQDIYTNHLSFHSDLHAIVDAVSGSSGIDPKDLYLKPLYAAVLARVHYWRVSAPIPENWAGLADYWNDEYNKNPEHGTPEEFIANAKRYLSDLYRELKDE